ncbi:MAG: hypothetical protein HC802_02505 [Caldilineaceae bacterium]|nr:hypothetical protein [Caldilineaceae bacterium]
MRIYLDQIGCRLNYAEMETLAGRLTAAGHVTVNSPETAQVIVFNSCAVTASAGRKSRQRIHQLHRSNAQARIAVTGCWATLAPIGRPVWMASRLLLPILRRICCTRCLSRGAQIWTTWPTSHRCSQMALPFHLPILLRPALKRTRLGGNGRAHLSRCRMAATTVAPFAWSRWRAGKAAAEVWARSLPRCS